MEEIIFGEPDELQKRFPADKRRWYSTAQTPREGWGMIVDVAVHPEHGRCIVYFIGQGRSVVITEDGHYVGDADRTLTDYRVDAAYISEHFYKRAHDRYRAQRA